MTRRYFERLLVSQCAPTFTGLKAANLVAFSKKSPEELDELLSEYETCLSCHRVLAFHLVDEAKRSLVLFYRYPALREILGRPETRKMLRQYGYGPDDPLETMLQRLRSRLAKNVGFPHEIGLFLGYPPHDVRGFVKQKGRSFLFCGAWKVYKNAESARKLFKKYAACTELFCARLKSGASVDELLEAV